MKVADAQGQLAREAPAGLVELSTDGRLLSANRAFENLLGRPERELAGRKLRELLTSASQVIYALKVERPLLETGEVREVFLELLHANGRSRPVLFTARAGGPPEAGDPSRRYGVLFPAPEWRAHERELVAARAAAEAAAETRARFLAVMSHELRTPLNGVLGMTSLIEASPERNFSREYADIIARSAKRLETIVDDILDFASLDLGEANFNVEPVDIVALVGGVCEQHRAAAEERGLALTFAAEARAHGSFLADPRRLRQILRPLIANAIKFTDSGAISVKLRAVRSTAGETLELAVSDTGVGFDPSDMERITAPFEQGDSSITRRFGGAGLGLAIVSALVKQMGGGLSARSAPGQGSTFVVEWPAVRDPAASVTPPTENSTVIGTGAAQKGATGLRILYAEDDVMNQILVQALGEHLGHDVIAVADGAQALERLETEAFDMVLMDMQMPVMDGLAATRELRRRETAAGRGRLPVIMLTANSMPRDVAAALDAGVDRHLAKPITAHYLQTTILDLQMGKDAAKPGLDVRCADAERERYAALIGSLSRRERQVLGSVVSGKTDTEIAREFGMSPRTVEAHRGRLMTKTGAATLPDLVRMTLRAGL